MSNTTYSTKSRTVFILLAIFLGGLGVHHFYIGSQGKGIAMVCGTVVAIFASDNGHPEYVLIPMFISILISICCRTTDSQGKLLQ